MVGERRLRRKLERRAQWNAVLVDGEWRLLDVLWASCALVRRRVAGWALIDVDGERLAGEQEDDSPGEKRYHNNEFFFLTDPDQFVCTHLPNDPAWQLLPNPLSVKQFETFFYVRERFFDLGLTMVTESQRSCVVKTTDAEVTIAFGLPTSPVAPAQFRYLLFRDQEEDARGESEVAPSRASVFFHQSDKRISYTCRMEEVGRYRMDIFGRHTDRHDRMDLVCSYIIVCESTTGRRLPAVSDIGWGPGPTLDEAGLIAVTHDSGIIYADSSEITLVHLKTTDKHMVFWHCLKHDTLDEATLVSRATLHMRGDDVTTTLRLPMPGEYAYMLFASQHDSSGDLANVCNYLIRYDNPEMPTTPFPSLRWGVLGSGVHAHALDFEMVGKGKEGYLETNKADVHLKVNLPISTNDLYCEISGTQSSCEDTVLETKCSHNQVECHLKLTETGEYALNMYVRRQSDQGRLHHVYSTLIIYDGDTDSQYEDETSLGGSQNEQSEETRESGCILEWCETSESEFKLDLPQSEREIMLAVERKAAQSPMDFLQVEQIGAGPGERVVSLPLEGDYVVDVFEVHEDLRLEAVRRIHIRRNKVRLGAECACAVYNGCITPTICTSVGYYKHQHRHRHFHNTSLRQILRNLSSRNPLYYLVQYQ